MPPPWMLPLFAAGTSAVAFSAFAAFSPSEEDKFTEELNLKKNSCWGFRIAKADNSETGGGGGEAGVLRIKLSEFGFWEPEDNTCRSSGLDEKTPASTDTFNLISSYCVNENYDDLVEEGKWGIRKNWKEQPTPITKQDGKAWKLVAFLQCVRFIKEMTPSLSEKKLINPVIGQFVS